VRYQFDLFSAGFESRDRFVPLLDAPLEEQTWRRLLE